MPLLRLWTHEHGAYFMSNQVKPGPHEVQCRLCMARAGDGKSYNALSVSPLLHESTVHFCFAFLKKDGKPVSTAPEPRKYPPTEKLELELYWLLHLYRPATNDSVSAHSIIFYVTW